MCAEMVLVAIREVRIMAHATAVTEPTAWAMPPSLSTQIKTATKNQRLAQRTAVFATMSSQCQIRGALAATILAGANSL
jgi:hypothetical protein